ncbi:MAG: serine/threonine-protein kinase [Xenococcus sp. MO_188.B8]|nr:serine/threonine-protein kinase [Xenococcus sp. MO_188.B8]
MENRILDFRYKIISFLGKGGFGTTYLAEDTKRPHNPHCVVKQLDPGIDEPEFLKIARRFFVKEAETLEKLGVHDQIPRLLANFEQDQEFYLVQEYIEGETLSSELSLNSPWPEAKVIDLLRDCLTIIDFVHSNGVIHRDIKPDNLIRRSQDNKIVLVDFGTVKEVIMSKTQTFASTVVVGSRGYMPTEQARGKPRFCSDIYALGMIAIQALTGIEPIQFQEDDNGEIIWSFQANCSPKIRDILTKMTRYNFKDRYQSASEILEELNSYIFPGIMATQYISSSSHADEIVDQKPGKIKIFQSKVVKTVGTLSIVSLVVTGAIYLLNQNSSQIQQAKITNTIESLEQNYDNKNYQQCLNLIENYINKAGMITQETIDVWHGKCGLRMAQLEAKAERISKAINIASKIPEQSPNYQEVKQNIDIWSEKIFTQAKEIYEQEGNLEEASQMIINTIPLNSAIKMKALASKEKWQQETQRNKQIIKNAQNALDSNQWQDAKKEAAIITNQTNASPFWRKQAQAIINQANEDIESAQNNNKSHTLPTSSTNNNGDDKPSSPSPNPVLDVCEDTPELC